MRFHRVVLSTLLASASLAACSGGSVVLQPGPAPRQTTAQLVRLGLPTEAIGSQTDAVYGLVGGFTTQVFSQILGFSPGQQIMIMNAEGDGATFHTFGDTGASSFASVTNLSFQSSNQTTIRPGGNFQTGSLASGMVVGPFTLQQGIYYIGCAYHYASNQMRDVLVVQPNATPGPQGSPPPGVATPAPGSTPSY